MISRTLLLLPLLALTPACEAPAEDPDGPSEDEALFGDGSFELTVVADASDGLATPRDLEFHPLRPNELWIVNQRSESVTVLTDAGDADSIADTRSAGGNQHFLAQPSSLAFSDNGNFATIHETDELTQGPNGTPADFMGPTLWTSDLGVFNGGHGGHLDMLHNSPNGMGIAWEQDNTFWVTDGFNSAIARYAFNEDHGAGGADHSDGELLRYVEGELSRVEGVPSHLVFDPSSGLLYVADTGNSRIAVLDTTTGELGGPVGPNYDNTTQRAMYDADLQTLVSGEDAGLAAPSGLELHDGVLYVGDNETGRLFAFDLDGQLLDSIELGVGPDALTGLAFDEAGTLFVADSLEDEVLRVDL